MANIRLPAQLDIRHVAEAHALLTKKRRGRTPPALDGSAVERVDTAGVQLIAAALTGDTPKATALRNASEPLSEALEAAGLGRLLTAAP